MLFKAFLDLFFRQSDLFMVKIDQFELFFDLFLLCGDRFLALGLNIVNKLGLHLHFVTQRLFFERQSLDFVPNLTNFLLDHDVHRREYLNVKQIFNNFTSVGSRKLHERHKTAASKDNNLCKRLVVHLQDVLFQPFLLI